MDKSVEKKYSFFVEISNIISSKINTCLSPGRVPDKLFEFLWLVFLSVSGISSGKSFDEVLSEDRFKILFIAAVYCRKLTSNLFKRIFGYWS